MLGAEETFLVVTIGEVPVASSGPRDAAKHPTMHRVAPTAKKYAVLKTSNLDTEYLEQRLAQRKPFGSVSYNIISKAQGKA